MRKRLYIISAILVLAITGCGGSSSESVSAVKTDSVGDLGFASNSAMSYDYSSDSADYADYDAEVVEAAPYEDDDTGVDNSSTETGVINQEKLVYRGTLNVMTLEFDECLESFKNSVTEYGGFIESERLSDNTYSTYTYDDYKNRDRRYSYTATVRVPSSKYEEFFQNTRGLGSVRDATSNVENISQEYATTQTSMEIYQAKYDRLMDLLSTATDASEIRLIQDDLFQVELEIARYKTSLSVMDTDVVYSYLTVTIDQILKQSDMLEEDNFFTRLVETCEESVDGVVYFLQELLFWIILYWWYVALLVLVIWLLVKLNRRMSAKSKNMNKNKNRKYMIKKDITGVDQKTGD